MGGCNGDDSVIVPQCRRCHDRLHNEGPAFWLRVRVDPYKVIERMQVLLRDEEQSEGLAVSPFLAWME